MIKSQETKEGKMTNVEGKRGSAQIEELLTRIDGGTTHVYFLGFLVKNRRFTLRATLPLWVMMGF